MKRTIITGGRRIHYILIQAVRPDVWMQALPEGQIRVYAPKYMGLKEVDRLVSERSEELIETGEALDQKVQENRWNHPMTEGSAISIEGIPHIIRLQKGTYLRGEVERQEIRLTLPIPTDDQAVISAIRAALSARALVRIRERVEHYAPLIGRRPGRITVREQKRRWGSCSAKGNLNFNWKLIMAPPQALNYVVIHELCHLCEFNHSPRFWQLVERQMPEYQVWKQWLTAHRDEMVL